MHGLGNDFVVLDGRREALSLDSATVRALGNRRTGVGFDQLVILERPSEGGHVRARFYNPVAAQWGPVRTLEVLDCARAADLARHWRAVEADYATAQADGWAWNPATGRGEGHTRALVFGYARLQGGTR